MSRVDWKSQGRYSTDALTNRINSRMQGWRNARGDWVQYYHLNDKASNYDDVFDEAIEPEGLVYLPAIALPCQHVRHIRGANEYGQVGKYYNDNLNAILSYQLFSTSGLPMSDIRDGQYLSDRIVYNRLVFAVTKLTIQGKIQERPTIVTIEAKQCKPDELVDQPQFAQYSQKDTP